MTVARRILACLISITVMVAANPVWAQTAAPQPSLKKAPAAWIGMAFMFIMMAIVVAISIMPSKRSHQD